MDWQARYYPPDVFQSLEQKIEAMIQSKTFGTPGLKTWAKNHATLFFPLSPEIQLEAAAIESAYPDLMDPRSMHLSADAYVIALAKVKEGIVVSQETSAQEKRNPKRSHFIPDVCRDLGIACINLLGLMRREKWTV